MKEKIRKNFQMNFKVIYTSIILRLKYLSNLLFLTESKSENEKKIQEIIAE